MVPRRPRRRSGSGARRTDRLSSTGASASADSVGRGGRRRGEGLPQVSQKRLARPHLSAAVRAADGAADSAGLLPLPSVAGTCTVWSVIAGSTFARRWPCRPARSDVRSSVSVPARRAVGRLQPVAQRLVAGGVRADRDRRSSGRSGRPRPRPAPGSGASARPAPADPAARPSGCPSPGPAPAGPARTRSSCTARSRRASVKLRLVEGTRSSAATAPATSPRAGPDPGHAERGRRRRSWRRCWRRSGTAPPRSRPRRRARRPGPAPAWGPARPGPDRRPR